MKSPPCRNPLEATSLVHVSRKSHRTERVRSRLQEQPQDEKSVDSSRGVREDRGSSTPSSKWKVEERADGAMVVGAILPEVGSGLTWANGSKWELLWNHICTTAQLTALPCPAASLVFGRGPRGLHRLWIPAVAASLRLVRSVRRRSKMRGRHTHHLLPTLLDQVAVTCAWSGPFQLLLLEHRATEEDMQHIPLHRAGPARCQTLSSEGCTQDAGSPWSRVQN